MERPSPRAVTTSRGPVECAITGAGPVVLALHGAMGGVDQSWLLAETIGPPGLRYIAVSRPGYLGTPLAAGRSSEDQADLYAELLDRLDIHAAGVMAVSGGGPSALHFALRYPARCRYLVLVSTCGGRVDTPIPWSFHVTAVLAQWPAFVALMQRRALRDEEAWARRSIPDPVVRARTLADPEAGPLLRALTASTFDRMALRLPGTKNDIEVTRTTEYPLERVAVPVLIVHGTADRMVPFRLHATTLASRIPGAELLAIEGGEHVAIFTHRGEVRSRVASFLSAHA
jgi:pimeloyl-ACP methyl ester carboxylesterase